MLLPHSLLSRIRGPVLAVAVVGCGSAASAAEPATPAAPELVAMGPMLVMAAADPVSYDLARETARLDALDAESGSRRRERRIARSEPVARPNRPARVHTATILPVDRISPNHASLLTSTIVVVGCGRG